MSTAEAIEELMSGAVARLLIFADELDHISVVTSGMINDEGPHLTSYGINCESNKVSTSDVTLSFFCYTTKMPDAEHFWVNVSVGWFRGYSDMEEDRHPGFSIYEINSIRGKFTETDQMVSISDSMPRMEAVMERAMIRGETPNGFLVYLKRLLFLMPKPENYPLQANKEVEET